MPPGSRADESGNPGDAQPNLRWPEHLNRDLGLCGRQRQ
jgi:hypothetical protein